MLAVVIMVMSILPVFLQALPIITERIYVTWLVLQVTANTKNDALTPESRSQVSSLGFQETTGWVFQDVLG